MMTGSRVVCVDLASSLDEVPEEFKTGHGCVVDPMVIISLFNQALIQKIGDQTWAYRANLDPYAAEGKAGLEVLGETIEAAKLNNPKAMFLLGISWTGSLVQVQSLGVRGVVVDPNIDRKQFESRYGQTEIEVFVDCRSCGRGHLRAAQPELGSSSGLSCRGHALLAEFPSSKCWRDPTLPARANELFVSLGPLSTS